VDDLLAVVSFELWLFIGSGAFLRLKMHLNTVYPGCQMDCTRHASKILRYLNGLSVLVQFTVNIQIAMTFTSWKHDCVSTFRETTLQFFMKITVI